MFKSFKTFNPLFILPRVAAEDQRWGLELSASFDFAQDERKSEPLMVSVPNH